MKHTFDAWSKFVLIDSTYQLLDLEYPIVIVAIVDGNSYTEIISIRILVHEDENSFRWFITQLKEHHETACRKIQYVMADKDMVSRKIIKHLINVPVYICSFRVQQIFRRSITNRKHVNFKRSKRLLSSITTKTFIF